MFRSKYLQVGILQYYRKMNTKYSDLKLNITNGTVVDPGILVSDNPFISNYAQFNCLLHKPIASCAIFKFTGATRELQHSISHTL